MRNRAYTWALPVLAAVVWVVTAAGAAPAAEASADDLCRSAELAGAEVSTSVRLEHDDQTYTKVVTELTVTLPGSWPLAPDLLLSENSRPYIEAMACLIEPERDDPNWDEQRTRPPMVTSTGGRVTVVHKAHGWVNYHQTIKVGLWRIRPTGLEEWKVWLDAPEPLLGAWWDEITVDPGRTGAERAKPDPRAGEGATALVWRPGKADQDVLAWVEEDEAVKQLPVDLAVSVTVKPPWQRSWAARSNHLHAMALNMLGVVLWAGTFAALLQAAVRRYRRRPCPPIDPRVRTLDNLRRWAPTMVALYVLAAAEGMTERILEELGQPAFFEVQLVIRYGCALLSVLVLLSFARPRHPLRTAIAGLLAVAVVLWTAALWARTSDSVILLEGEYTREEVWLALVGAGSSCLVVLLLLSFTAAAWRLAVDGRLVPPSRRLPGRDRRLRLRVAGPAVLAAAVALAVCLALAEERSWQQASWLMDRNDHEYGANHRFDFVWTATWGVSWVQEWLIVEHGWQLTSLALIAVLRSWHDASVLSPLHDVADRVPLLAFFSLAVGLDAQNRLDNALLEFLWIPLYMLALYGTTALLAHRSVLAQRFEISRRPLATVGGPAARRTLLDKARSYREIHAELRRLDQGLFGDVPPEREKLERRLGRLHNWRVNDAPGAAPDRLPDRVSVVDVALALGPRDDWWGNGVRGARFALVPGIPAAVLDTWSQWVRGEGWQNTLADMLGFAGLASTLVSWTVTFAGAGFVLGSLWRVLPGRRGAVKALPVAVAFAVPVGLDVLVTRLMRESAANVALYVLTMLFVLTVTGIALDLDTFAGERRYWQSRLGLLLSVYQMRYYSLQVAYLIGQIIAIITIWQFFAEPNATPSSGEAPPASSN
ncbi:DUF6185 family protein [Streptomyces sp. SP17KL33]|uniref:DUF6185 family protein n=1 Tax=Streptomyces sp. SP17KL33 TaxID=3002534 RepID=UPI002E7788C4|nr:DUF6185 family protein [Streptomyces sp. SP17KL33]MEE1835321.1 DUF6185 family protein [Streptomyces sp. SP17KL33]